MRHTPFVTLALLALAACAQVESAEQAAARMATESAAARTAIDSLNVAYERYQNGGQADSVAMLFAEDAVLMPPLQPMVTGRAAIAAWGKANPVPPGATIAFAAVDVRANGAMVTERGTYAFSMPAAGKTPAMTFSGKYVVLWKWVDGRLLQTASIWNDDAPPPSGD